MPFSDIFVEAQTKVSASRKAYLRHLYIKPACYEENALVSASEVFASKSDDRRKIIPGSLRIVFRIPVPPVEIPEATASERPALRLIRRIALSLTFASSRSIPTHSRCTLIQTHCSFSDSRRPIGKAAGPNLVPNPFKFSPMIKKLLLSLSAVFCMTAASAQTQTVKGRVVDENNAPVIGATIVVKNRPTIGTSPDVKGEFPLHAAPNGGGGETPNLLCRLQNPGC